MSLNEQSYRTFQKYLPAQTVDYCYELWQQERFAFKITKSRKTKLGDYRYNSETKRHQVSVNGDLNPYSFLITYLHEVAHLVVQKQFKGKVPPHGTEWKNSFTELLVPVANADVFPENILVPLKRYMKNPKASTVGDQKLYLSLADHNPHKEGHQRLHDILDGETFEFKGKAYRKIEKRRTRALCEEVKSGKKYLISLIAELD